MLSRVALVALVVILLHLAQGGVYLQNPRGSNNRLNEKTAQRTNDNRLFDGQDNKRGGYNVGDRLSSAAGNDPHRQYSMQYYGSGKSGSSKLMLEWTNQHGCGGNPKLHCNIVIQYMCMNNGSESDYSSSLYMRDGTDTNTQSYKEPSRGESSSHYSSRMKSNDRLSTSRGVHETPYWYDECRYREANGGLFRADQKLASDSVGYATASRTRQNGNGNRFGLECPEERDYFPYWRPTLQMENSDNKESQRTPWIDLAWLGDRSRCNYIKKNSFNTNAKHKCVLKSGTRKYGKSITQKACSAEGGNWVSFNSFIDILTHVTSESACKKISRGHNKVVWGKLSSEDSADVCYVQAPELKCDEAPWTRVNQLGNADNYDGFAKKPNASRLEIDLPYFPSGQAKRCVMRIRYNISSTDYDGWRTSAKSDNNAKVISNNPTVDIFGNGAGLEMAISTDSTGRTFQDRSHIFLILPRTSAMEGKTIYNLNVRGKRGNIVETFPATEYDFIPNKLAISTRDLLHVQWTGSNTHNNNNDGDSGEGKGGTDRSNILQMSDDVGTNYPLEIAQAGFWSGVESLTDPEASGTDIAIGLASAGYYCSKSGTKTCSSSHSLSKKRPKINNKLDNAPASYFGHVLKFKKRGHMNYLCTRNNNFSNRSQKGSLWVR